MISQPREFCDRLTAARSIACRWRSCYFAELARAERPKCKGITWLRRYVQRLLRPCLAHVPVQDNGGLRLRRLAGNVERLPVQFFRLQEDLSQKPNPSCSVSRERNGSSCAQPVTIMVPVT